MRGLPPAPRRARPDDLAALVDLETACFDRPWSEMMLRLEIDNPPSVVLVADGARGLAGYAALRAAGGEAELLRVGVRPAVRGRGVGRRLVRAALAAARGRGARRCYLEVRPDNRAAISLYRRLGFNALGHREKYYADGTAAFVMGLEMLEEASPSPDRPPDASRAGRRGSGSGSP